MPARCLRSAIKSWESGNLKPAGKRKGENCNGGLFKKAFQDMKESAKAQHQVDKANFAAVKAQSKAQWEEAKAMGDPKRRKAAMQAERDAQIEEAKKKMAGQKPAWTPFRASDKVCD